MTTKEAKTVAFFAAWVCILGIGAHLITRDDYEGEEKHRNPRGWVKGWINRVGTWVRSQPSDSIRPVSIITQRGYTKEELSKYDGEHNSRILVSVKRKVYEVGHHFYGPGQSYHVFAGKEISRSLAMNKITDEESNKYWANCSEEELNRLEEWAKKFESKYPIAGWFIPDNSFYHIGNDHVSAASVSSSPA